MGWDLRETEVEHKVEACDLTLRRGSGPRRTWGRTKRSSQDRSSQDRSWGIVYARGQESWSLCCRDVKESEDWKYLSVDFMTTKKSELTFLGTDLVEILSIEWGNFTKRKDEQSRWRNLSNWKLMGKSEKLK